MYIIHINFTGKLENKNGLNKRIHKNNYLLINK
jgi:hypothetical protein